MSVLQFGNFQDSTCNVCFRHCNLKEGQLGFCGGRICKDGRVIPANYGWHTACYVDPIEKKPFARFFPGTKILSIGSYGCNLRCPFCQNNDISWGDEAMEIAELVAERVRQPEPIAEREEIKGVYPPRRLRVYVTPEWLVNMADDSRKMGVIGIAFTYNEPLIGYEYVLDTFKLARERGLKTVLVTNGTARVSILEKLLPYTDAMNIDLKAFTDRFYSELIGGDRRMTMEFIKRAVQDTHVELTTLIIPGENDTEEEMLELATWVSHLRDKRGFTMGAEVPLHVTKFHPCFHMTDREATDEDLVYRLAHVAHTRLNHVYVGNVRRR